MKTIDTAMPVDRPGLAEHYRQVESFQSARARTARRSSKVLAAVAGVAILGNLAQAWTIAALVPLTKIVPVYLWVRADGTVDSSVTLSRLPASQSKAVINSALFEYLRLREGYAYDTAQYNYDIVSEMSAPAVREVYQAFFNYPNPTSPQVTVGRHGVISIEHISSADIAPNVQQIRFKRTLTLEGARPTEATWTATLTYGTVSELPVAFRLRNPGGVIINGYQAARNTVQ